MDLFDLRINDANIAIVVFLFSVNKVFVIYILDYVLTKFNTRIHYKCLFNYSGTQEKGIR